MTGGGIIQRSRTVNCTSGSCTRTEKANQIQPSLFHSRKIKNPLSQAHARVIIENNLSWHIEVNEPDTVLLASETDQTDQIDQIHQTHRQLKPGPVFFLSS